MAHKIITIANYLKKYSKQKAEGRENYEIWLQLIIFWRQKIKFTSLTQKLFLQKFV